MINSTMNKVSGLISQLNSTADYQAKSQSRTTNQALPSLNFSFLNQNKQPLEHVDRFRSGSKHWQLQPVVDDLAYAAANSLTNVKHNHSF